MDKDYLINYSRIPVMGVGFTRSTNIICKAIQIVRKILNKKNEPDHCFFVTVDRMQKFATEETINGLCENSLEVYTKKSKRIVAIVVWDNPKGSNWICKALDELALIRRRKKEDSMYDIKGLFSFLPFIGHYFKPDEKKQWCSENVASILKKHGATFITKTEIAPDTLLKLMRENKECYEIHDFYYQNINVKKNMEREI